MAASNAASASVSSAAPRLLLLRRRGGASASAQHRNARFRPAAASAATSAGGGSGGGSYLDMWRKAVERERLSAELARRLQEAPLPAAEADAPPVPPVPVEDVRRRTARFEEMLRVPREERDRVQRRQVIDRAAAALAAARAVLKEPPPASPPSPPPTPPQVAETAKVGSAAAGAARGSDRSSRPAARTQLSPSAEGIGFHWVHLRLSKDHAARLLLIVILFTIPAFSLKPITIRQK